MIVRPWEEEGGLFRSVVDAITDGVTIVDPQGVQRFLNRAFCEMVGYSSSELLGASPPFRYWPKEHVQDLSSVLDAAMRGSREEYEVWLERKNGELFPVLLHAGAVSEDGRIIAYVATVKDISERKKMERALLLSEERWRAIAENPFDYVVTVDRDYRYTYVNHPAPGVKVEDLIGKATLFDHLAPEDHPVVREICDRAFRDQKPGTFECFVPLLGQWLWTVVGPIVVDGVTTAVSLQARDVTSQKLAEQALRQAQRMEALGRLAGGIAHDFNNLLMPILGNASLLQRDTSPDDPASAKLADIITAAERAADLVSRVLVFGREQSRRRQPVRLQSVVREVSRFMSAATSPNVKLETKVDEGCPPVLGAPDELHQVVTNLCTNALQAVADRGGTVTLSLEHAELPGSCAAAVRFSVRDTGVGIPETVQARVFDPFFTTRPVGQGTGLGLSIVQSIVTRYGGSVTLQSTPGAGTRLDVLFPACEEPAPRRPNRPVEVRPALRPLKLVCIDDEPLVLSWLARTLQQAGHDVRTFTDPREARKYLLDGGQGPDCVICDETMPFLTGTELAAELAKRPNSPPMLLVSGYAPTAPNAASPNVRARLPKPLAAEELLSALAEAVSET